MAFLGKFAIDKLDFSLYHVNHRHVGANIQEVWLTIADLTVARSNRVNLEYG